MKPQNVIRPSVRNPEIGRLSDHVWLPKDEVGRDGVGRWQLSPELGRLLGARPAQLALDGLVYIRGPSRINRSLFYSHACPGLDK